MWHATLVLMDHHLAWSNYLFTLFNHISCNRRFANRAQAVEIECISDRDQFRVYPKKHHPQFTKHAPHDIANDEQRQTHSHVSPAQRARDGGVVKLHAGPDREGDAGGGDRYEAEKVDHFYKSS